MTTIIALNVQPDTAAPDTEPINLYKLGMLFVVKCRYWSLPGGQRPRRSWNLTPDRIDAKALASFGTKDLLDPEKTRKRFQQIEKKARHALEKHSRPFAAANAHFVPWNLVEQVINELQVLRMQFDDAVFMISSTPTRPAGRVAGGAPRDSRRLLPPDDSRCRRKFGLTWHAFKVTGAPQLSAVEDVEMELEERRARDEQVKLMEASLQRECQQFVEQYVLGFRQRGGRVLRPGRRGQQGQVHGKTLNAIRDRIDRFHRDERVRRRGRVEQARPAQGSRSAGSPVRTSRSSPTWPAS
jgi:hypothetical protein